MAIRVTPGPPSEPGRRQRAEDLQRLYQGELELVRAQAEKWRNGLVGLLGIITVTSLLGTGDAPGNVGNAVRVAMTACQLGALATASAGAYFAMRAAFGVPKRQRLSGDLHELLALRYTNLAGSIRDLRIAIWATFTTLGLLGTGLAFGSLGG